METNTVDRSATRFRSFGIIVNIIGIIFTILNGHYMVTALMVAVILLLIFWKL